MHGNIVRVCYTV